MSTILVPPVRPAGRCLLPPRRESPLKRDAFEKLVAQILATLPAEYAERLHNLVVLVEDWADAATLTEVGLDDPAELLGFYSGTPLTERVHDLTEPGPDRIILYREAIERESRLSGLPLRRVVRETLWHEIAHYFGFSEEDMARVEAFWAEGKRPQAE